MDLNCQPNQWWPGVVQSDGKGHFCIRDQETWWEEKLLIPVGKWITTRIMISQFMGNWRTGLILSYTDQDRRDLTEDSLFPKLKYRAVCWGPWSYILKYVASLRAPILFEKKNNKKNKPIKHFYLLKTPTSYGKEDNFGLNFKEEKNCTPVMGLFRSIRPRY